MWASASSRLLSPPWPSRSSNGALAPIDGRDPRGRGRRDSGRPQGARRRQANRPVRSMGSRKGERHAQARHRGRNARAHRALALVAEPRRLLLLGPWSKGEHVVMPLDKTHAMTRLTGENIRAYEHRADGPAGNAFRALGQLVAQCDVYRLCVGEGSPTPNPASGSPAPLSTLAGRIRGLLGCSA